MRERRFATAGGVRAFDRSRPNPRDDGRLFFAVWRVVAIVIFYPPPRFSQVDAILTRG